jgi:tetratricopeptide (TPR) repeat protein
MLGSPRDPRAPSEVFHSKNPQLEAGDAGPPTSMKLTASILLALAVFLPGCNPKDGEESSDTLKDVEALVAKKDVDTAIARLVDARAKGNADPKISARLAELYEQKHDISKAVIVYKDILERHPEIALAHVPLGTIYLDLRQFTQAKTEFETARSMGIGDEHVALPLGICQGQMGNLDAAENEFERALKAGVSENTVHFNQALLRTERKQYKEAKDLFEDILAKDPKSASAKRELAHVLQVMSPTGPDAATLKRSMDLLWEVKDELKDDPRLYEFMGDGWLLVGDYDACLEAYTEALRLGQNPKSVEDKYVIAKQRQIDAGKAAPPPKRTMPPGAKLK